MHVHLAPEWRGTPEGEEGAALLSRCVHCGFCLPACPTYRLLGDELDSPRGRLYLIKGLLEGAPVSEATRSHLDRCLTCRACETACPSGVEYAKVLEVGRLLAGRRVPRRWSARFVRLALRNVAARRRLFGAVMSAGRLARPLLPAAWPQSVGTPGSATQYVKSCRTGMVSGRQVLLLRGCVQPALAPDLQRATTRVLAALGIEVQVAAGAGCCGAVRQHLDDPDGALDAARRNIDAWWPWIESPTPIEAIVTDASGCGVQLKDYGYLLRHDSRYAARADRVASLARDLVEIVLPEAARLRELLGESAAAARLAFHSPCTLQHGQRLGGRVEQLLRMLGAELPDCAEAGACCGAAGTYSLLQPELARELRARKLSALLAANPDEVLSANATCLTHLGYASPKAFRHWVQWLDALLPV